MIFRSLLLLGVSVAALHAGANSGASTLLAGETQGLALDFTDDFWQPTTGFYGSARIIDTGTPANNYDSSPTTAAASLLTYTSPSLKMTMGPNGTLRFGAHNLYLNSASPANQSITVVSGMTYAVTITGTVSVAASGAATGTWTAGTQTFTAATGTLTFGSTSGAGTVHVRRTPSDSTYLATAAAARYALPYEWDSSGNLLGILVEEARTNLCLYSDDLTNAAWTKTNVTAAKTATGPDGIANSASTLTATAGNAVALQNIVSASAARSGGVYLKRRTGTGAVSVAIGEPTGSELITNGAFAADTDWTKGSGWSIGSGVATGAPATSSLSTTATNLTAGKLYAVTFTITSYTSGTIRANIGANVNGAFRSAIGTYTEILYPSAGDGRLYFVVSSFNGSIDNVSVYEVAESNVDLSSGAWVRGTIENKTITNPCLAIKLATSGDAVDVALADVENGAFVTSPIPTLGSTVTRAVDNISLATSAFPWAWPMSIYAYGTGRANAAFVENNNTTIALFMAGAKYRAFSSGASTGLSTSAADILTTPEKVSGRFNTNNVRLCVGGTLATADTSASAPADLGSSIRLGYEIGGAAALNRHIQKVLIVPRDWSDAELQSLTAA